MVLSRCSNAYEMKEELALEEDCLKKKYVESEPKLVIWLLGGVGGI